MTLREPTGEPPENENAPHISEMGEAAEEHSKSSVRQPVLNIQEGQPTPNPDAACDFLQHWKPGGPWPLCAFHPDEKGNQDFEAFTPATLGNLPAWIKKQAKARRNVYFHVNTVRAPKNGKAEKEDVMSMDWFHVDADPADGKPLEAEQQRIRERIMRDDDEALPPASVIIFSGGGYQGFWRQRKPIMINCNEAAAEDAELYNRQIAKLRGGDKCHNADRIMRLPGTINWPNAKKRKRGQVPVVAELIRANWDVVYDIDQFLKAPPVKGASSSSSRGGAPAQIDTANVKRIAPDALETDPLLSKIESRAKVAIVQGTDPDQPLADGNSRSHWVWHVACAMVRAGVDDTTMYSILTDPDLGISEHVLAQGNGKAVHRCAVRTIERAKASNQMPEWLLEINADRFAVLDGGKTRFYREAEDGTLKVMNKEAFDYDLATMMVEITRPTAKGTTTVDVPASKLWHQDPARRYYPDGFVLDPTYEADRSYNLWRGFSVAPKAGDWSLLRKHLFGVLAEEHADYVLKCMAWKVQHPDEIPRVAIVFRGGEGVGKGILWSTFQDLFGMHGLRVQSMMHVAGRFNAHLRHLCVLFADEVHVVDREQEGVLKGLITEPDVPIEGKGLDVVRANNHVMTLMATNNDWAVPAGLDARRFAVFDVSSKFQGDRDHFQAIVRQLDGDGRAAMLHDLLAMPLGDFHPEAMRPDTAALSDQKQHSLRPVERHVLECLKDGELPTGLRLDTGAVRLGTRVFTAWLVERTRNPDITETAVGRLLRERLGFEATSDRPSGTTVLPLAEARARWDERMFKVQWDELGGDWNCPPAPKAMNNAHPEGGGHA